MNGGEKNYVGLPKIMFLMDWKLFFANNIETLELMNKYIWTNEHVSMWPCVSVSMDKYSNKYSREYLLIIDYLDMDQIFFNIHGIPYIITFIVMEKDVMDASYSMLLGRPLLRDAKVSHD